MNDYIFELIQVKCHEHGLYITASENVESAYLISDWGKSKFLNVQILTPIEYLHEKELDPYEIETACTFSISKDILSLKPDFVTFGYQNISSGKISFLIVQTLELLERFEKLKKLPKSDGSFRMTIYAGPDDYILDATEISAEGEWYFFGGRMGKKSKWDFSMYLNQWDVMFDYFTIPLP